MCNITKNILQFLIISKHRLEFGHSFIWDNIKILDHEQKFYKRLTSEVLHIKEQSHKLNLVNNTNMLDTTYSITQNQNVSILNLRYYFCHHFSSLEWELVHIYTAFVYLNIVSIIF